jgi:hypothetical protein
MKRKTDADRFYHVAMYALAEEIRILKLDRETIRQRQREIWETCYGKKEKAP